MKTVAPTRSRLPSFFGTGSNCSTSPQLPGYVLLSVPDQPHVTNVVWIFNADLKGWLPRYLVDQTLANLLMKHHECMRLEMQAYNPDSNDDDLYV